MEIEAANNSTASRGHTHATSNNGHAHLGHASSPPPKLLLTGSPLHAYRLSHHTHHPKSSTSGNTPSPDSAVHSAYYSSPAESPLGSRHAHLAAHNSANSASSGVSSPFVGGSQRSTPSLSRNNSDASQYSSNATSPLSPLHQQHQHGNSPSHSPVAQQKLLLPLPGGSPLQRHSSLPHGYQPQHHQLLAASRQEMELLRRRSSPAVSEGTEAAGQETTAVAAAAAAAQTPAGGISRQQLINRYE